MTTSDTGDRVSNCRMVVMRPIFTRRFAIGNLSPGLLHEAHLLMLDQQRVRDVPPAVWAHT
ncbi:MAG TPA: hypothetical protein VLK88_17280 [Gemmatimonadales bacterium]|nr:hypothetical protein [Gemmatimonadales bacterium]